MNPSTIRKMAWLYPLLLLLCGFGYMRYDSYKLDGDAVAFMDIADAIRSHDYALAANGYWNPGYAAALAAGESLAHPSRWTELHSFYWVNFCIFAGCILGCVFFVSALVAARERFRGEEPPALSYPLLVMAGLAVMFLSFQRELSLTAVRSDSLMLLFLLLAAGCLVRIVSGARFVYYPLLGLALGLAYLTKSFGFLPAGFLLLGLFLAGAMGKLGTRKRAVGGAVVAGLVFVLLAGPYVAAISKQRGRPTTGESARLNYCFFVDQTARWHEWHSGKMGHATANFKHHEQLIVENPPVYSFAQHPLGTYPLWFDPAYWTDTLQPHFYLKGHLLRLVRCTQLLIRFVVGHLEGFVLVGVLLLAGCGFARRRPLWLALGAALAWGVLMVGIYFPVDLQDRYLTPSLLLVVIPLLALLRVKENGAATRAGAAVVILLAALTLADAARDIGERRRVQQVNGGAGGPYNAEVVAAAKGLEAMGVGPGSQVACFGDKACYLDFYWARLAQTPIRAEMEIPNGGDPAQFWNQQGNQREIVDALRARNIAAIVAEFDPEALPAPGWHRLGDSDYFAYPLK